MIYNQLYEELLKNRDESNAYYMEKYMKNKFPFLGIKTPIRNKIASPFIKELVKKEVVDFEFVDKCYRSEYRELQYIAINYLEKVQKRLSIVDLKKLESLITTKSWWDTSDSIDHIIGYMALRDTSINKTLLDWSAGNNTWLRRVAIIHQLDRKDKTDTKLLETIICNSFGTNEFFIDKAIGWALREYSKINSVWVRDFINKYGDKLSKLSIKEGSKYL